MYNEVYFSLLRKLAAPYPTDPSQARREAFEIAQGGQPVPDAASPVASNAPGKNIAKGTGTVAAPVPAPASAPKQAPLNMPGKDASKVPASPAQAVAIPPHGVEVPRINSVPLSTLPAINASAIPRPQTGPVFNPAAAAPDRQLSPLPQQTDFMQPRPVPTLAQVMNPQLHFNLTAEQNVQHGIDVYRQSQKRYREQYGTDPSRLHPSTVPGLYTDIDRPEEYFNAQGGRLFPSEVRRFSESDPNKAQRERDYQNGINAARQLQERLSGEMSVRQTDDGQLLIGHKRPVPPPNGVPAEEWGAAEQSIQSLPKEPMTLSERVNAAVARERKAKRTGAADANAIAPAQETGVFENPRMPGVYFNAQGEKISNEKAEQMLNAYYSRQRAANSRDRFTGAAAGREVEVPELQPGYTREQYQEYLRAMDDKKLIDAAREADHLKWMLPNGTIEVPKEVAAQEALEGKNGHWMADGNRWIPDGMTRGYTRGELGLGPVADAARDVRRQPEPQQRMNPDMADENQQAIIDQWNAANVSPVDPGLRFAQQQDVPTGAGAAVPADGPAPAAGGTAPAAPGIADGSPGASGTSGAQTQPPPEEQAQAPSPEAAVAPPAVPNAEPAAPGTQQAATPSGTNGARDQLDALNDAPAANEAYPGSDADENTNAFNTVFGLTEDRKILEGLRNGKLPDQDVISYIIQYKDSPDMRPFYDLLMPALRQDVERRRENERIAWHRRYNKY